MAQILQVVPYALAHLLEGFRLSAQPVHLGKARDAGPDLVPDHVAARPLWQRPRALDAPGIEGQTLLLTSPPLLTAREYVEALSAHMD